MNNLWTLITNNIQFLIVLGAVFAPVIGGIMRWLRQKAEQNRAEALRRRQIEAQLRTGRVEPDQKSSAAPASAPPETFAERRRRQIEAAQRQQQAPVPPVPSSENPVVVTSPSQGQTQARAAAQQRIARAAARRRAEADQKLERGSLPADYAAETDLLARRFEQSQAQTPRIASPPLTHGFDRTSMRRAIVLSEVLAPPIALRGGPSNPAQR